MNLSKHLSFAKNFAFDAKRVGVFFVFYALALLVFGGLALCFLTAFGGSLNVLARGVLFSGSQSLLQAIGVGAVFLLAFVLLAIVFFLVYLWLFAGTTRLAAGVLKRERKSFRVCLNEGLERLPALVVLSVLVGLLGWVVTVAARIVLTFLLLIPVAGPVLYGLLLFCVSLALGLAFLFAQFFLLVKDAGIVESARESVRLFMRKPCGVLLAVFGYLVVVLGVLIVCSLPLVASFLLAVASLATFASKIALFAVFGVVSLAILLLGLSFIAVFNAGFFSSALLELSGERIERAAQIKGKRTVAKKKRR